MTTEQPKQHMSRTYTAVQATQPGELEVVERAMIEPAFGQVRIRIEACGVCHSDALTVEGGFPGLTFPRVPGHEVAGKIEAIRPGVQGWKEGQRVGVRVNVVAPGPVETGMLNRFPGNSAKKDALISSVPVKRVGEPEEIAEAIVFLSSGKSSYITGASLAVDGGKLAR